jgi:hypothetical protein
MLACIPDALSEGGHAVTDETRPPDVIDSQDRVVGIDERGLHLFDLEALPWDAPAPRPGQPASASARRHSTGVEEKWLVKPGEGEDRFPISIVRFPPNFVFPKHWHTEGEFIMILKGSANFAGQEIGVGAMAYNDARTIYGAEAAGPEGCEFLMIRRAWSKTTITDEG